MITNEFQREAYLRMLRIRRFEEAAIELSNKGELAGALHVAAGQEGEIVGACMALGTDDYMVGNHRSHGHPIGKGAMLRGLMAELLGRKTGVNQGKGGSMHLADFAVGSLGETSIVGSGLPVAVGAALGAKMQRSGRVSLCFFGDGASNEGTFHESLNLAAIWKLPVIFLCENNGYAITTAARHSVSVEHIASRGAGYGIPGEVVDGQDVLAVHDSVRRAVERAREGGGPSLIEAKTYRYMDHAKGLPPLPYRTEDEMKFWMGRDPLILFRHVLLSSGASEAELLHIENDAKREVDDAVEFARASAPPPAADAYLHVYATSLNLGEVSLAAAQA
jgi:acetoin:2,6-dichlorophenolindophenol oxidoreductase subunit alpha